MSRCPSEELTSIMSQWHFTQWGLDLISPFLVAKGGVKFVVIEVDYTKWVKVEALATITAQTITKFLWKSVVCWFNISHSFMSKKIDNLTACTIGNGVLSWRSWSSIIFWRIRRSR